MRTIIYKGARIEIEETTPEYRALCEITRNVYFFVSIRNAGVGLINNTPCASLALFLRYARKRINKAKIHPRHGW